MSRVGETKKLRETRFFVRCIILVVLFFKSDALGSVTLYDIDFSSPTHVVGSQMTVGYGPIPRETPSEIVFGEQIVVDSYGSLSDQPVQLIPDSNPISDLYSYSQFSLDFQEFEFPVYSLEFDIYINSMTSGTWDGFTLLYDVPSVVRMHFSNDYEIIENDTWLHVNPIYSFGTGELLSMSVLVDLPNNTWQISCNNEHLYSGQFFYPSGANPDLPTYINSVRFNLANDLSIDGIPGVAIDNIRVYGIPEPSTLLLLGLGVVMIRRNR